MLTPEEMYMREHALATVMGATPQSRCYGWGATIEPPSATKSKSKSKTSTITAPNAVHSTSPSTAHLSVSHPNATHSTSPIVHSSIIHSPTNRSYSVPSAPTGRSYSVPSAPTGRSYSVPSAPTGRFYGRLGTTPLAFHHSQIPSAPTGRFSTAPPPPPPQQGSHSWFNRPVAPLPQSSDYSASQSDMTAPDYSSYPHHHHHHHPHIPYDEAQIATQPSYDANVDMNYAQQAQTAPVYDTSDQGVYDDSSDQNVYDGSEQVVDDGSSDIGFGMHWAIPMAVGALGYRFYRNSRWY
jgi:hypothetical protein